LVVATTRERLVFGGNGGLLVLDAQTQGGTGAALLGAKLKKGRRSEGEKRELGEVRGDMETCKRVVTHILWMVLELCHQSCW
jgi:hypothetical protein